MSSKDIAISARGLSKAYTLAHNAPKHTMVGEAIIHRLKNPVQRTQKETFWALKDVEFDIEKGDVVGVIGRNGAGKSTLLKVLSRITKPTTGQIDLYGRVGSLLEVGTGFHPELTGRENIFLNGAILGMRKREIEKQFDAIVDFAEVERFLDTPVKRYSSGMYIRLAFAVAAHLNPEILIIDEVLAVGDSQFQKKCLGKMKDVAQSGRTVLFVSHNMASISHLCNRGIFLEKGTVRHAGDVDEVMRAYLDSGTSFDGDKGRYRNHGDRIAIDCVEMTVDGIVTNSVQSGDMATFEVTYHVLDERHIGESLSISLMLYRDGEKMVNMWTNYFGGRTIRIEKSGKISCTVNKWPFRSQRFRLDIYTHIDEFAQDWIEDCLVVDSYDGDYYGSGVITNPDQGIMFLGHNWQVGN